MSAGAFNDYGGGGEEELEGQPGRGVAAEPLSPPPVDLPIGKEKYTYSRQRCREI